MRMLTSAKRPCHKRAHHSQPAKRVRQGSQMARRGPLARTLDRTHQEPMPSSIDGAESGLEHPLPGARAGGPHSKPAVPRGSSGVPAHRVDHCARAGGAERRPYGT